MIKRTHLVLFAALIIALMSATLAADVIVLKTGSVIEGEIVEETEELVAIELDTGGTGFFSKEDIKSINKTRLDIAQGRIVEMTGAVEVFPKDGTEWKAAEEGMSLGEGDTIRSGPDSKAVAVFAGTLIMAVEQETEVDLEKLQQSPKKGMNIRLKLNNGQIWNDIGRLRSKRSKFYVETPQAVTGVRGTVFTVQVAPDNTTKVAVVKGNVDVRTRGMMVTPVRLRENNMTEVAENQPPAEPTAISEEYLEQWNQYKSKFQRLRISMTAGGLKDYPTSTKFIALAVAVIVIILVLNRFVFRRRRT
ncbi:MAG: FecR domain-containing protein [Candidatus Abyssubacteria bacterium]|nr:FecR domain-containing protein [Candidatus Abyssubacteria bacterium]